MRNDVREGPEICDGDAKNCVEIDPVLYTGGKAKCLKDCSGYDTATCDVKEPECGNGVVEEGELCDGAAKDCTTIGGGIFVGGTAPCTDNCDGWDSTKCITAAMCGNDVLDANETCDKGTNSATKVKNCVDIDPYAFSGGKAKCNAGCDGWDTATCEELPTDNDTIDYDTAPDTDTACSDACTPSGKQRCFNETVQTCTMGFEGCLIWSNTDVCYTKTPAQICKESLGAAYCESSCTNDCTSGDRRCNPTYPDQVDACTQGRDGCYHWTYYEDCSYWEMVCVDPGVAGCEYPDTSQIDTIGSSASSYTGGDRLKGNYVSCTSSRKITKIETYMHFTGGIDITYAVYSATSQTGTYTKISDKTVYHYSSTGVADWYSSGAISWNLTSGYYYFIAVYFGTTNNSSYPDPTYYYKTSLTTTSLAFGSHLGGGESATFAALPSSVTTIDNAYGYYMRITTE